MFAEKPGVPGSTAVFNGPIALAVDVLGNVLVSDFYNNVIRKVHARASLLARWPLSLTSAMMPPADSSRSLPGMGALGSKVGAGISGQYTYACLMIIAESLRL